MTRTKAIIRFGAMSPPEGGEVRSIGVIDGIVDPPSGTVTFLLTDVEGSTQAWETHAGAMDLALRAHDAIVRGAAEQSGGYVFSTAGDSFAVAFSDAGAAL